MVAERANGIVAQANYYTASELTAHLASEQDAGFKRSWSAMRRLATRTSFYDGSQTRIRFSGDAEDQLCYVLFGASLANRADQPGEYAALIQSIAQAETFTDIAAQAEFIRGISASLEIAGDPVVEELAPLSQRPKLRLVTQSATAGHPMRNKRLVTLS